MKKLLLLALFGLLIASCEPKDPKEETFAVTSVSLSQATAEMIPGETAQLIATVLPANATDKSVNWASSKQSVATVSNSGLVTALAEGSTTITASCGGKSATCQVTVSKGIVAVSGVTLDQTDLKLAVGDEALLKATVSPDDATDRAVTWSSSNSGIVTVDQGGRVKAIAEGSATITAAAGGKTASCKISVLRGIVPVASVALDRISVTLEENQTTTLIATVSPADATDKTVTWSTSDASVATVGQDGLVTAVKQGATTITAKAGSQTATCKVTVKKKVIPVAAVSISRTSLNMVKGQTETLTATVSPEDATDKTVTWSSSDATIVSVDQTGKVTALQGGSATVMAKAGDQSATCSVTVTVPVQSLTLDRVTVTLEEKQTTTLVATVSPSDATDKTVTWTSSDETVASVDQNGKVTALHVGMANIVARAGEKTAVCNVTVTQEVIPVKSVGLNKTRLNLTVGAVEQLTATVNPDNATDKTITWTSSDATIVSVDPSGKVKALKGGTATITAAAGDKSATAFVDVLEVTPGSVEIEGKGGKFDVSVITTRSYHISSKPDWVQEVSVEKQVHHFEVPTNDSDQERSGVISICDDEGTCLACLVKQAGFRQLEVDLDELFFDLNGGREEVKVSSTMNWTVSSSESWCSVSPSSGSHDGAFSVTVGEYRVQGTRQATLTVRAGDLVQTIRVEQDGIIPFSLSPTSVEFGDMGGTFEIKVRTSSGYHLSGMPDWITEKSVHNKTHVFQVAANPTDQERSGVVSFCDDEGTCLSCLVRQAPHIFGPDEVDWSREFYHRSLYLRFTATWCGYCPRMASAIKKAQAQIPGKLEAVSLHGSGSSLYFSPTGTLENQFGISGYPAGILDCRRQIPNYNDISVTASVTVDAVRQRESSLPTVTTAGWKSTLSGQTLSLETYLFFKEAGNYKVTVLLVEDGIVAKQTDYDNGDQNNYRHDGVARVAVSNIAGESVSISSARTRLVRNYSVNIPSSYVKDNLRILVYIQRAYGNGVNKIDSSDFNGYFVDNCVSGKAGSTMRPPVISSAGGGNEDVTDGKPINW